ncbi:PhzF family phenazine biosynthesis protein [Vibrio lentus]|nr:PhzF family phenazine biosynthesis protein [Vibrio lentus]
MGGVNEDPVTGSAHCALTQYWSEKLNKAHSMLTAAAPRWVCIDRWLSRTVV